MSKKVWVTGIAGFLGSHLADALVESGYIVQGNDIFICGDKNNLIKHNHICKETDCRDYAGMLWNFKNFKPDIVVHCAATAHEGLSSFSPSFITKNIFESSVAVYSAAIQARVKKIINMSSMSRYGDSVPPFTEDTSPKPVDPYAVAKVAAEQVLDILCRTHDVLYVNAVPHNIIGVRQRYIDPYRNVASIMINRCKQNLPPIVYGDGLSVRCFSPIDDCLTCLIRIVEDDSLHGETINIGPDKGEMTIRELAWRICDLTGYFGGLLHVPARANEVKYAYCSSDKARRLLDYKEKKSIDECLKEMVDAINPQPFLYDFPIEIRTKQTPKTWTEKMI